MMAGAGGAMRATGWRATAIRFQQLRWGGDGGSGVAELDPYLCSRVDHISHPLAGSRNK